jgi:2-iminobutanoate/2-iminopropanoate deaminase
MNFLNPGDTMTRNHMEKSEVQKQRAYSPGVITEGGRIVWLAGHTAAAAELAGNLEAQTRAIFCSMDETLQKAGGRLADLVTMTVFIRTPRMAIASSRSANGNYPASALITVAGLARPGMVVEIQGVAVIGGSGSTPSCIRASDQMGSCNPRSHR